jgi:hypothetical protein
MIIISDDQLNRFWGNQYVQYLIGYYQRFAYSFNRAEKDVPPIISKYITSFTT